VQYTAYSTVLYTTSSMIKNYDWRIGGVPGPPGPPVGYAHVADIVQNYFYNVDDVSYVMKQLNTSTIQSNSKVIHSTVARETFLLGIGMDRKCTK